MVIQLKKKIRTIKLSGIYHDLRSLTVVLVIIATIVLLYNEYISHKTSEEIKRALNISQQLKWVDDGEIQILLQKTEDGWRQIPREYPGERVFKTLD